MTPKELLIQGLDNVPEPVVMEVLDFLNFLKSKQEQDLEDLQDARAALLELGKEEIVSWQALKMEVGL
jgi:predicted nuclease of restriction endonuclease-like (RecB) superfamily